MLTKNIDALKLATALIGMQRDDTANPRMSLLDLQIFLSILNHPDNGKNGLLEIINGSTTSKSFLDRPIDRLVSYGLITKTIQDNAATITGAARVTYTVSPQGHQLLNACRV